jgi:hypothetical protein
VKSRIIKMLGLVFAVTVLGNPVPPAYANLNISADACQPQSDRDAVSTSSVPGVKQNIGGQPIILLCSVPRSPLVSTATLGMFYVDGDGGGTCTLYSFDYTGAFLGSSSFTNTQGGSYDGLIVMPAAQLPVWAYTSLLCQIPFEGDFRGVTVVQ